MCVLNLVTGKQDEGIIMVNCSVITLGQPTQKQLQWVHSMLGERENEGNEVRYVGYIDKT